MRVSEVVDPGPVLSALVDSSPDAVIGQTPDGTITLWNLGAELMYGFKEAEVRGRLSSTLAPDPYSQEQAFILRRVAKGEQVQELLTRRVRKDGAVIEVSMTMAPVLDEHGVPMGIVSTERDVTRRRRVDSIIDGQRRMLETLARAGRLRDALRELLDSHAGLTDAGVHPAIMTLREERRVLEPVASRLPEVLDKALARGVPIAPDGHPAGEAAFRCQPFSVRDIERVQGWNGLREASLAAGMRSCCSTPVVAPGGDVVGTFDLYSESPGDFSAADLEVASAFARTAALAIERYETVRELRLSRTVLIGLNEISGLLLADLDIGRIIRRVTEEGTRLVEGQMGACFYNRTDASGAGFRLYSVAGPKRDAFKNLSMPRNTPLLSQTLTVGAIQRIEDVTRDPRYGKNAPQSGTPDGHPLVRSFISAPVTARSGEVIGMLLFGHEEPGRFTRWHEDIIRGIASQTALALDSARLYAQATERAEALSSADDRKNEFLAMLGHELRNPLGAMATSIAVLQDTLPGDDGTRGATNILQRQAKHMKRLVDDLLDLSRVTRGKIALRKHVLDARVHVRQAVVSLCSRVPEQDDIVNVTVPDEPVWIEADAVRMEQIVGNLLGNSLKFSPPGSQIDIELDQVGSEMRLVVRDRGQGIAPQQLNAIFDMFVQAQDFEQPSTGGLGLGLTLVRELARLHGGRVSARSDGLGKGSEFEVRLPLCKAPEQPLVIETEFMEPVGPIPVLRILLAEDQADAGAAMAMLLEHWGHKVVHVKDGVDALYRAREMRPDVALLDLGLPGLDGFAIAQSLKRTPHLSNLRLAAITGRGQSVDIERSQAAGFERHFIKPVEPPELHRWLLEVATELT